MRDIKFRIRLKAKEDFGTKKKDEIFTIVAPVFDASNGLAFWTIDKIWELLSADEYTGREDSEINGKQIFDSDIIENVDTKDLQVVYWNEDEAAWYCRYVNDGKRIVSLSDSLGNLNKKVGNIYENPELLNK